MRITNSHNRVVGYSHQPQQMFDANAAAASRKQANAPAPAPAQNPLCGSGIPFLPGC